MLTCKEVSQDLASDALERASWRRRVAVRLHLMMCDGCRRFAREIAELGSATRRLAGTVEPGTDDDALQQRLMGQVREAIRTETDRAAR